MSYPDRPVAIFFFCWSLLFAGFCGNCVTAQTVPQTQSSGAQSSVAATPTLKLKDGTLVRVRIRSEVSSRNAKAGDKLEFSVANDVLVGGLVCIRRGASALGHVAAVQKKRRMGRGGKLAITIDSVETISGNTVSLRSAERRQGGGSGVSLADTPVTSTGYGAPIYDTVGTVGRVSVFALMKGKDAEIPALTTLAAYVNGDAEVDEAQVRRVQPPPMVPTGLATIYVLRPEQGGEKNPSVYCGSVEVGRLSSGHYLDVQIPPGEYQFQSAGFKHPVRIKTEPEQAYYIQFFANRVLVGGSLVLMEALAGDDLAAFLGGQAELKVDLSKADTARLRDTAPPPTKTLGPEKLPVAP